jgi:hypothetical protein
MWAGMELIHIIHIKNLRALRLGFGGRSAAR